MIKILSLLLCLFLFHSCFSQNHLNPTYQLLHSENSSLSYTFNWSPGTYLSSTTIANPTITLPALTPPNPPNPPNPPPPVNYLYTLTVQNIEYGCIAANTQTVAHTNPRKVYLFSAFTPDNDGINDYFRPLNIQDYTLFGAEFWIYNRWGEVVFHKTEGVTLLDWSWNGKVGNIPQETGIYAWRLKIPGCPWNYSAGPNSAVQQDQASQTISGIVSLIR